MPQTTLPSGRYKLASVIRAAGDVIKTEDVVAALSVERTEASKLLSRWAGQGWLRRVGRGAYVPAPLDLLDSKHVLSDPWILVPALYAPAYIGGRTAAEHWDLTEQLFRDIFVMTAKHVRKVYEERHGALFRLRHIPEKKIFGTKTVWRHSTKILVSDVHRTIVDMLDDPSIGGGIQHVADCFAVYLKRDDRSDNLLIEYAERMGNGAIFKRLGFLADQRAETSNLAETCRLRLTKGNARLDPQLKCPRLITKWNLCVPQTWSTMGLHD